MKTAISDRWQSQRVDNLMLTRYMDLKKRCKPGEKIGYIDGIPSIMPKTALEIRLTQLFAKLRGQA